MIEKNKSKKTKLKLPPMVFAEASVKSVGSDSLFETQKIVTSKSIEEFYSKSQLVNKAVKFLRTEGFKVLQIDEVTINISAPVKLFERVFKTKIIAEERETIKELGQKTTATYLECPDTTIPGLIDTSKSSLRDVLEGVALNEPVYYFGSPSPFPPYKAYWHLDVPKDVSFRLKANHSHRIGFMGNDVKVVMVDSGWYRHPFFIQRGYRASSTVLGPGANNPNQDEHGHGTGESANIFSVAPNVNFNMVKLNFVNSIGAFKAAVALKPDIISCSWGSSVKQGPLSAANQALAAAIARAVKQGIIVVFSAGNGHWGFPGQHPDVISAGGVFVHQDCTFEASNYASGFSSNIYQDRNVPDVCGLVGQLPRAQYIMLPVEPKDYLDTTLSNGIHPNGDETTKEDGWAAFSGTSAAAPQIAGVCALMKQACPRLSPIQIRSILKKTARDVTSGNCHQNTGGHQAVPGHDLATGYGLVDAYRATKRAWLICLIRDLIKKSKIYDEDFTEDKWQIIEDLILEIGD
jgi:hypothetical protein